MELIDVPVPIMLTKIFRYIDISKETFINNLKEVVAIPSISCDMKHRGDVMKMLRWIEKALKNVGAKTELCETLTQNYEKGKTISQPPILLASTGNDSKKKTLCVYGHIDVKNAQIEDGWSSDPFIMVQRNGKLCGRGTTDDKGPILCWIHVLEAFLKMKVPVPINIKFVIEGMHEVGSQGLNKLIVSKRNTFFSGIDYCCIPDGYWLGTRKPCLTYGLRGLCYFTVEVTGGKKTLDSGHFGGAVYEPLHDLIFMLNSLVDLNGDIDIPGLEKDIAPMTPTEESLYKHIDVDTEEICHVLGVPKVKHQDCRIDHLMSRWRRPSLSVHGIEKVPSEPGVHTIIPNRAIGKFSIRIVPDQKPERVKEFVITYLERLFDVRRSPNRMKVEMIVSAPALVGDPTCSDNFKAAQKAVCIAYKIKPDLIREGGTVPIAARLHQVTGSSVLLLPIGAADDGAHGNDEKLNIGNYIGGHKMVAAYFYELGIKR
uniref:Peptidase M20 dimerisation domain-containing protein n=1 Tax=Timema cristinae TaxID=61476 RepID=A0A7R9CB53_TIMCR|nr:unnamed protein product [Timema cristinae]